MSLFVEPCRLGHHVPRSTYPSNELRVHPASGRFILSSVNHQVTARTSGSTLYPQMEMEAFIRKLPGPPPSHIAPGHRYWCWSRKPGTFPLKTRSTVTVGCGIATPSSSSLANLGIASALELLISSTYATWRTSDTKGRTSPSGTLPRRRYTYPALSPTSLRQSPIIDHLLPAVVYIRAFRAPDRQSDTTISGSVSWGSAGRTGRDWIDGSCD